MIISKAGAHLELLARVQMKLDLKLAAPRIGAGQCEAVEILKLEAFCKQLWRVFGNLSGLCVDHYLHWIASFFLVVEAGQPRPAPHLLQN